MITDQLLKQIYPFSSASNRLKYLPYLNQYLQDYDITTSQRLCCYLAQIGHESGQLNYSEEIASGKAYEGRKDLGNIEIGDGVKFKGRGLIQITGRSNYARLSKSWTIDLINNPQMLKTPDLAVRSSLWFWKMNKLNDICDSGNFELLTRKINGGLTGLADRLEIYNRCKLYLD